MKRTQIEKAIDQLEAEKRAIDLAILKLKSTQATKPVRVRKTVTDATPAA